MVVIPEKQIYEVIANVQAKLESRKCQFVEPVSATTGGIYHVNTAKLWFF
jgi:hypothetical protein